MFHGSVDEFKVGAPDFEGVMLVRLGLAVSNTKTSMLAWTYIVESISETAMVSKVFRLQSPTVSWKSLLEVERVLTSRELAGRNNDRIASRIYLWRAKSP